MIEANKETSAEAARLAESITEGSFHVRSSLLSQNGWIAVPVESGYHFNETDASRISRACSALRVDRCFAVATEHLDNFPTCWELGTTKEELLHFSKKCAHFNFVLFSIDTKFVVLCTTHDYYLVAGPGDFVKEATGGDVEDAQIQFAQLANDDESLSAVARRYMSTGSKST